jgi:fumarate hydratase subunit beta
MGFERINDLEVRITMPITDDDVSQLKIGDHVRISGTIYTARDAAHNRMSESLNKGEPLPLDIKACMGKGNRGPEVQQALKEHHAVYFMAIGGAGALLSQYVKKLEVIAYEDLGTESLKRVVVEDFPAVVMDDCEGRDLLNEGRKQWRDMSKLGNYTPSDRIVVSAG